MTLTTGCSSTPTAQATIPDPLNGDRTPPGFQPPPSPKADAGTITPVPTATNAGGVPALPASFTASNPATLAATSGQSPLGRPLAIDDNHGGPPFLPGQTQKAAQPANSGLSPRVERVPDVGAPSPPPSTTFTPGNSSAVQPVGGTQPTGDDLLRKQLEQKGVINQKLDRTANGVHLTCYISRGEGLPLRIAEVDAADYATAAQAILQNLK
jgi:hypothetical protein